MTASMEPEALYQSLSGGDRRALARSITFAESSRLDHRAIAHAVIEQSLPATSPVPRIGISGTPGVGKSTFIEALGLHLLELGHRPAVLSIDPSSTRTGGSILGDKTRMPKLAASPDAFIRPSASGGVLGGVATATDDVMLLCEAAGYGPIVLETVGTGQSETAVDDLTDLFVLLVAPGGGDDLQGIKRGVMELIDVLIVNKADGSRVLDAEITASSYRTALSLMRPKIPGHPTAVTSCSAALQSGVDTAWSIIEDRWNEMRESGGLEDRRAQQRENLVRDTSLREVLQHIAPSIDELTADRASEIRAGSRSPAAVALDIVATALDDKHRHD